MSCQGSGCWGALSGSCGRRKPGCTKTTHTVSTTCTAALSCDEQNRLLLQCPAMPRYHHITSCIGCCCQGSVSLPPGVADQHTAPAGSAAQPSSMSGVVVECCFPVELISISLHKTLLYHFQLLLLVPLVCPPDAAAALAAVPCGVLPPAAVRHTLLLSWVVLLAPPVCLAQAVVLLLLAHCVRCCASCSCAGTFCCCCCCYEFHQYVCLA
jgi:hypothetical protein